MGIGTGTWLTAILMTVIGYLAADLLNKEMLIVLAIVNPIYFFLYDDWCYEKPGYIYLSYSRNNIRPSYLCIFL